MQRRAGEPSTTDQGTRAKITSAAVQVLKTDGARGMTTRRVAKEAGVNPALVHYYFDSIDSLMLEVVDHIAESYINLHETKYSASDNFSDAWRQDMYDLLAEDAREGKTKVWYEAMAVVWNDRNLTHRYGILHRARSRQVMKAAAERQLMANGRRDVSADAEALAVLISVVRSGLSLDKLLGFEEGHRAAVDLLGRLVDTVLKEAPPDEV